ncbi:DUF481 domain-containing protein [Porticoccaceae bacterium LTM1]|nr:DUF481 domain-containing protein [Porticoccaceae bacterium LTM1]
MKPLILFSAFLSLPVWATNLAETENKNLDVAGSEAASKAEPPAKIWHGIGSLGFNNSTGNSHAENLFGKIKLVINPQKWRLEWGLEAALGSNGEKQTRQTYINDLQLDYDFSEIRYGFANLHTTRNKYGAFRHQSTFSTGMGWRTIKGERSELSLETGLGVRQTEENVSGLISTEKVVRGKLNWVYQLNDTAKLVENFRFESGMGNTTIESEAGMHLQVSENVGLKVSYRVISNTEVPEGEADTETLTAVSLGYLF